MYNWKDAQFLCKRIVEKVHKGGGNTKKKACQERATTLRSILATHKFIRP